MAELYASRETAEAWRRSAAARGRALGPATELMLDLADLEPGRRVLDVAAGTGEQTLLAAERVGPRGFVLATDISASMLEAAATAARQAGFANVAVQVTDARALALAADSFEAAICRSGLMLMAGRERALAEIRRVLRPGGTLVALVPGSEARNPYPTLPFRVVRRLAGLPPPPADEPGMFALGRPGLLEVNLRQAGFRAVAVRAVATRQRFPSLDVALRNYRESFPSLLALLDEALDPDGRQRAWLQIKRELRRLAGPNGLDLAGEVLVGVGTK